ncbi:MAG: hypothetical protein KQJ78_20965 [Deltaproteobacteria bacterium]|nr:hypothetical protein [Deltaproteobacteria bacterium]
MRKQKLALWRAWTRLAMGAGLVLLAGGGWAPGPALAAGDTPVQGQKPVPLVGDAFHYQPGAWAVYQVKDKKKQENYRMRLTTLERATCRDQPGFWMEIAVTTAKGETVVTRLLAQDTPRGPGTLCEVVVQPAGYDPFVVPESFYQGEDPQVGDFKPISLDGAPNRGRRTVAGREIAVIEVGGRDAAGHPVETVVSEEVPPLGLVLAKTADTDMVLTDWGLNGQSGIKGEPLNFYLWLMLQIGQALGATPTPGGGVR